MTSCDVIDFKEFIAMTSGIPAGGVTSMAPCLVIEAGGFLLVAKQVIEDGGVSMIISSTDDWSSSAPSGIVGDTVAHIVADIVDSKPGSSKGTGVEFATSHQDG